MHHIPVQPLSSSALGRRSRSSRRGRRASALGPELLLALAAPIGIIGPGGRAAARAAKRVRGAGAEAAARAAGRARGAAARAAGRTTEEEPERQEQWKGAAAGATEEDGRKVYWAG
jgi:hypothetical protein